MIVSTTHRVKEKKTSSYIQRNAISCEAVTTHKYRKEILQMPKPAKVPSCIRYTHSNYYKNPVNHNNRTDVQ